MSAAATGQPASSDRGALLPLDAPEPDGGAAPWDGAALRLPLIVLATALVAFTSRQGGLAAEDAAVFINARNGLAGSPLLIPYAGYASLLPDLISALLAPLPLVVQALGYMAAAFAAGVLFAEEAWRLLRRFQSAGVALAGAVFLLWLLHSQIGFAFLNLTYLIWPGLLWGALRLARSTAQARAPGWGEGLLLLAMGLSHPLALAWAPALAFIAWKTTGAARWRMAGLLGLIVAYAAANVLLAPQEKQGLASFGVALAALSHSLSAATVHDRLVDLAAAGVVAAALAMAAAALRARLDLCERDRVLLHLLDTGALATLLYLASDRFLLYRSFVERYAAPALVTGATAALVAGARQMRGRAAAGVAVAALLLLPVANLARGHLGRQLEEAKTRIAFLGEAQAWRAGGCPAAQARVQSPGDRWSLVIPCRRWPQPATTGFYRLTAEGGLAFSAAMSLEAPGVFAAGAVRATPAAHGS